MLKRHHVGPRLSEMAIHANVVYLAGQVPSDGVQGIAAQTRDVLQQIDRLLSEAGSHKSQILSVQIFLSDIDDIGAMNAIWDEWVVAGHTPPRATVQARLARPEWLIEIVLTAALIEQEAG